MRSGWRKRIYNRIALNSSRRPNRAVKEKMDRKDGKELATSKMKRSMVLRRNTSRLEEEHYSAII